MFENLRQSINDLASGAVPPAQRAAAVAHMRATLVQAKVGIADIAAAVESTRSRLVAEQQELATVRRRKSMAAEIRDKATVDIATQFETKHAERVDLLSRKLSVQEEELRLAETEVDGMIAELKGVSLAGPAVSAAESDDILNEARDLQRDIDGLARKRARESREAEAEDRLAELKRRMQK